MIKLHIIHDLNLPYKEQRALEKRYGIYRKESAIYEVEDKKLFEKFFSSLSEKEKFEILMDTAEAFTEELHMMKHNLDTINDKLEKIRSFTD